MSLGLKQALGDPWINAAEKFPVGAVVEGPIMSLTSFGVFVQVSEGMEGMIHVGDISSEKRINHPRDILKVGQFVKARILELDTEKRRLKLGMKQLAPTSIDEYLAEHQEGDIVSGRVIEVSGISARVELGEGIQAACPIPQQKVERRDVSSSTTSHSMDLASLSSMLKARWKNGSPAQESVFQALQVGQVRSFRITKLDRIAKKIEVELQAAT